MSDFDRLIKLLAMTDGRDKIYKFLAGFFKILAAVAAQSGSHNVKAYKAVNASIGSARSIMRMGKWVADVPKCEKLIATMRAKGITGPQLKNLITFFRTVGNSLYVLGDNAAFLSKMKLLPCDAKVITKHAKVAQFWGFFLAAVLDLMSLRAALVKRASDEVTSTKEAKAALINLAKDGSDTLVTMATVGYFGAVWHPTAITSGALTCVSGGVATYLNWNKC